MKTFIDNHPIWFCVIGSIIVAWNIIGAAVQTSRICNTNKEWWSFRQTIFAIIISGPLSWVMLLLMALIVLGHFAFDYIWEKLE